MKNVIEFIKEKSYYLLGITVVVIVFLLIIGACSNGSSNNSYEGIESNMTKAAYKYYEKKSNLLPNIDGKTVKVTVSTLVEYELLEEIKDPKDKSKTCTGYVEVTKVGEEYSYNPVLNCKGSYEPGHLSDKIKNVKADEYGNGVYVDGNEYIYRGDDVKNYVMFDDKMWRIVKIDSSGDIKLVSYHKSEDYYYWDTTYNLETKESSGITNNYLKTNIRKVLNKYYEDNFSKESKAKIVSKDLCVGNYNSINDEFSKEKECSVKKDNEKVGLLNPTDYKNASLDPNCTNLQSGSCINYNYLTFTNFSTWLLNPVLPTSYKMLKLSSGVIGVSAANNEKAINPVIYVSRNVFSKKGTGTYDDPYIIK